VWTGVVCDAATARTSMWVGPAAAAQRSSVRRRSARQARTSA
jgi:hypothetical protein